MINEDYEDDFVSEVRTTFFNFLKPFLRDLPDYFKDTRDLNDSEKVFSKYFDSNKYLQLFEGEKDLGFAKALLNSS